MSMRTPLGRARGLGSAKDGTGHFWHQRITAIANVPLAIAFVAIAIAMAGMDYEAARAFVARPLVAIALMLMVLSATYHMRLGAATIIEDYFHAPLFKTVKLIGNTCFSTAVAVGCFYAILKISLGG
jgi:succinate dehydrogenase / fumarate reductase membrane anchor subunit